MRISQLFSMAGLALATGLIIQGCSNKPKFESVAGDPLNARIYTLKNGLKVYVSVNPLEPRIQTQIAVRAGSKNDPSDATGLAHYLEHMLFKGTSTLGTVNWDAEHVLLEQISGEYENLRATTDASTRKGIYARIDSLSQMAAGYAVPNEYDKLVSGMGAKGTNAFTSVEQTVYINDIPSNELERWMALESMRFRELVLRLFHTELEAVYEEFNRGQDNDLWKAYEQIMKGLYQKHPYGTQTTIGLGEHLKNPSMVKIHEYYNTYYVPNNMCISISGDVDPDKAVAMVEKYFGDWKSKPVPEFTFEPEAPIEGPITKEVLGPSSEFVMVGYRTGGIKTADAIKLKVLDGMLNNGYAGLFDLNLLNKQEVLEAGTWFESMADYGYLVLQGKPREGQTLEEVQAKMQDQLELIKKGNFDDKLIEGVVNNYILQQTKAYETNWQRAMAMTDAFILNRDWKDVVNEFDRMRTLTKSDMMEFASSTFGNNYVVVYKRTGVDTSLFKVEKPQITPLPLNRDTASASFMRIDTMKTERIQPVFVDFNTAIEKGNLGKDLPFHYVHNSINNLFKLIYILDMGSDHSRELALAIKYLPYLGTDKYSSEELKKEFFRLGLSMEASSDRKRTWVTLSGLESSLEEGVALFEHVLANARPDSAAYSKLVQGIIRERNDAKQDKQQILGGAMVDYAMYGKNSPRLYMLTSSELERVIPADLSTLIHHLMDYPHTVFYYGSRPSSEVAKVLGTHHMAPENWKDLMPALDFPELDVKSPKVYYTDYDMVQAEIMFLSKDQAFSAALLPYATMYNQYFGAGLSSIVFQEIREAKALAYSAYSFYTVPSRANENHYVRSYIGTQRDKLGDAVNALQALMNQMPRAQAQFTAAKDAALKKIETERITRDQVYWSYLRAKDQGLDSDPRKIIYEGVQTLDLDQLETFFKEHITAHPNTYLVIGRKKELKMDVLRKLGPVEELKLPQIFGY